MSFADSVATDAEFRAWVLDAIVDSWRKCRRCSLGDRARNVVVGDGAPDPILLVVAEAPGEEEDETGRTLVGPAGRLFRAVSAKAGIDLRRDAFLTNVVSCRPPRNRTPEKDERDRCRPRLEGLARTLNPHVVLLLGGTAMRWLHGLPRDASVGSRRGLVPKGNWPTPKSAAGVPLNLKAVFLTWHPSHVLRQETKGKRRLVLAQMLADLAKVKRVVDHVAARVERLAV